MVVLGPRSLERGEASDASVRPSVRKEGRKPSTLRQLDLGQGGCGQGGRRAGGSWTGKGRATHLPVVEPLLWVGEVGAGAVATDVPRPGLAQVLGGLVGAVQVVVLQVVLGPLLHRPPGLDLPAFRGLHGQQGTAAIFPRASPLIVEQEAPGGHWGESAGVKEVSPGAPAPPVGPHSWPSS